MLNKIPRICVDFNEMLEPDLVLLSKNDTKLDSSGTLVSFYEGMPVAIYNEDRNDQDIRDDLIADGIVEKNIASQEWAKSAKWCCRISSDGIRNETDECRGVLWESTK